MIKDNIFGVFDGANSRSKFFDQQGRSGGHLASLAAKETFILNDRPLRDLALLANDNLRRQMMDNGVDVNNKLDLWHTTLAVVRINGNFFEWVQLCDSLILLIYQNGAFKLQVGDYDHDSQYLKLWKELTDQGSQNRHEIMERGPFLEIWNNANRTYGVLNGDKKFISFLKAGEESLENIGHILIFSDGLFIPQENPAKSNNFQLLTSLFLEGGLAKVKNYVRDLENSDPECQKYPRYKKHDDITAIAISF